MMFFFYVIGELIINVTISQKTNKPLCLNINLDPRYSISLHIYPNCYKKFFAFVFIKYKNERNECKFEKSDFYKNKKVTNIDAIDVNKTLVSKEERSGKKIHLSTLLDTMIMMLLDHYA